MSRKFTIEEIKEINEKYAEPHCLSYMQLAELFSVERKTIAKLIRKTFTHKNALGENNGNHVLTEQDVREMREIYFATDFSFLDIANQYGVSKSTALRAINGKTWKCVS